MHQNNNPGLGSPSYNNHRTSSLEPASTSNLGSLPPAPGVLDYLLILAKHKKMILLTTLGAVVIVTLYSLMLPSIYTAKTMILPGDDDKGVMGAMMAQLGGLAGVGGLGGPTKADLYVTMLNSETVKDPIIERFKLMELYKAKLRLEAYNALAGNVMIKTGKKDGVITITVDDEDPKRAADIANAYVEELGRMAASLNMTGAGKNRAFLEERLAAAKADLVRAEDAMKAFQSENKAVYMTDQAKASIEGIARLRGQLAAQEVELGTLQRKFTDSSQEVKTAKATVGNIRAQIALLEGKGVNSSIPSVGSVPQLGQDYARLLREFKIQETLVDLLTKQYEMVKINEVKDISPFQVLQKAKVPEKRSKPTRRKIVAKALLLSLLGSCGLALILGYVQAMPDIQKARWKTLAGKA